MGRDDNGFRIYTNHYSTVPLAKPSALRIKERDKKKYMCGRFSLSDEGHFEWSLAKVTQVSMLSVSNVSSLEP